jgi:hypothetical protein
LMSASVSVPDEFPAFADVLVLGIIVPPPNLWLRLCIAIQIFSRSAMFFSVGFSSLYAGHDDYLFFRRLSPGICWFYTQGAYYWVCLPDKRLQKRWVGKKPQ